MKRTKLIDRLLPDYTKGEERFNFVSHVVGGAFAIVILPISIITAVIKGDVWSVVGASIYGATIVILYTMSSIYHGLTHVKAKQVFRILDHCAVFLLIAGTYTPLALCVFRRQYPTLAWVVLGIVWGLTMLGIILNAIDLKKYAKFSMVCYLGMGWCLLIVIKPLIELMARNGIILLFAGGIAYTIGAILYGIGKKKVRYMHGIFHLFVIAGSLLHFFAIIFYVLPV